MRIDGNSVAVVTGGASGLGEATARALAAHGAAVSILDRDADRGHRVAKEIGGVFCHVDVTLESEVEAAFAASRDAIGQEQILVTCAGAGYAAKTVRRDRESGRAVVFPSVEFDRIVQINLLGTFRCLTHSAAGMLALGVNSEAERGVIITTASVAAEDGQVGQVAYSASKAAIVGMTLPIARDLASEAIRINAILPGVFDTPLVQAGPEKVRAALAAQVPFPNRLGHPDEFAALAMALIQNSYMNGESIRLDGAIRMTPR
jgi:NAD(P)-dependent dehydrogenase (short-subunit alcohol dehydrogenase family)